MQTDAVWGPPVTAASTRAWIPGTRVGSRHQLGTHEFWEQAEWQIGAGKRRGGEGEAKVEWNRDRRMDGVMNKGRKVNMVRILQGEEGEI